MTRRRGLSTSSNLIVWYAEHHGQGLHATDAYAMQRPKLPLSPKQPVLALQYGTEVPGKGVRISKVMGRGAAAEQE